MRRLFPCTLSSIGNTDFCMHASEHGAQPNIFKRRPVTPALPHMQNCRHACMSTVPLHEAAKIVLPACPALANLLSSARKLEKAEDLGCVCSISLGSCWIKSKLWQPSTECAPSNRKGVVSALS